MIFILVCLSVCVLFFLLRVAVDVVLINTDTEIGDSEYWVHNCHPYVPYRLFTISAVVAYCVPCQFFEIANPVMQSLCHSGIHESFDFISSCTVRVRTFALINYSLGIKQFGPKFDFS